MYNIAIYPGLIAIDSTLLCAGHEFRVVILSVVRTQHSINKDLVHQCGFYTDKRILNTAFTRVQSLIVTVAHPLSLITRGHMSCRLFWASYLSQSLSDEECDQLKTEFVNLCKHVDHKEAEVNYLNPKDYEVCCMLIKDQQNVEHVSTNENYYDQILDDLEKEYVSDDDESLTSYNEVQAYSAYSVPPQSNATSNVNNSIATYSSSIGTSHSNAVSSTISAPGSTHVPVPHRPYDNNHLISNHKLFMMGTTKSSESGYALVLNPAEKDIWLADSYALNRSLRGDTVAVDKLGSRKGRVVANECRLHHCLAKKFFMCYSEKYDRNRLVPIDRQYPKIHTLQKNVTENGLKIFVNFSDNPNSANNTDCIVEIMHKNIEKYVYLVQLNPDWVEDLFHPTGVPVKYFRLDGNLKTFFTILKYNYIPAMPYYNFNNEGGFSSEVIDYIAEHLPINVKNEIKKREKYLYKNVFTIDDEETVVLDDALSLEHDQDKNYVVNVHIADASYFVKPGSDLDRAASERGRTFYINYEDDRAMFMLPDNICIEHGSLQAGKERLAVTTQFVFSKDDYSLLSQLSDVEVHRSIVCSVYRLTKEDAGRFLLEESMTQLKDMSTVLFSKMKEDLSILGKIAKKLRQSQWPDSYLYEPDRGKQDKYSMAGGSLVEMFMCLCNTAIPAKLLKRDGRVGPVLVHAPIKHYKQHEWLENHHHLLECCPLFKRMVSKEVLDSFKCDHQNAIILNGGLPDNKFLTITQECWDKICGLSERSDGNSLATYLCSLNNFPELFVAYRQLCKSQSKSFYDIITNEAQALDHKHSKFDKIYSHFTSPLRRYCDILVHRAVLGETSLPSAKHKARELLHKMNIHKWDEREFSRQRNMLYVLDCYTTKSKAIAVTAYVGKITNKLIELHATPELQEFLPDRICEIKLSHLQAKGNENDNHLMIMEWQIEIIPAPGNELSREDVGKSKRKLIDMVKVPLGILANAIEYVHHEEFIKAKDLIKSCKTEKLKWEDVEQKKEAHKQKKTHVQEKCHELDQSHKQEETQHFRTLIFTKWIREYSKLDIQLSYTQEKSYAIEPTVSLIHISQGFSSCLLHVKHSIECYAPHILTSRAVNLKYTKTISHYVQKWEPAVEAESITNSITSKRIPLIIKDLRLVWTSTDEAHFNVTDYVQYKTRFQTPFSQNDYICVQYHNLLPNPSTKDYEFELDRSKKITWVAHGRIVKIIEDQEECHGHIVIKFSKNTTPPDQMGVVLSAKPCDLEVIPFQVTFR